VGNHARERNFDVDNVGCVLRCQSVSKERDMKKNQKIKGDGLHISRTNRNPVDNGVDVPAVAKERGKDDDQQGRRI